MSILRVQLFLVRIYYTSYFPVLPLNNSGDDAVDLHAFTVDQGLLLPPAGCAISKSVQSLTCLFIYLSIHLSILKIEVPVPVWHVARGSCGGSGLLGFSVGRREQGRRQEFQKEEPHFVCPRSDGHQLLSALTVWWRHGLHLWNHIPFAL